MYAHHQSRCVNLTALSPHELRAEGMDVVFLSSLHRLRLDDLSHGPWAHFIAP
jgi:hypothetical protein